MTRRRAELVDQMRTIQGGVFRLSNSTLHTVCSKVTGKLV